LAFEEEAAIDFDFVLLLYKFKSKLVMSVLEMKGELHDLLSQVNEESHLEKIKAFMLRLLSTTHSKSEYDGLTEEQYAELLLTIEESEDEENLVSEKEAHQMFAKWKGR
jgi:hypothetical protein